MYASYILYETDSSHDMDVFESSVSI